MQNHRSFEHLSDSINERVYRITDEENSFIVTLLNMGRYFQNHCQKPYASPKVIWKLAQISTNNHLLEFFYSADGSPTKCLISAKNSTHKRAILWNLTSQSEQISKNERTEDSGTYSRHNTRITDTIYDIGDMVLSLDPRAVFYYDSDKLCFSNETSQYFGPLVRFSENSLYNFAKFEYNSSPRALMLLSEITNIED